MDATLQFEKFTGQARRAIWLAYQEAQRFDHDYLASEHLLAGLVREGSSEVAQVFRDQNIGANDVPQKLEATLIDADPVPTAPPVFLTPRANHVLRRAVDIARAEHAPLASANHVLHSLITDPDNSMRTLLQGLGFDFERGVRSLRESGAALNRDLLVQSTSTPGDGGRVDPT